MPDSSSGSGLTEKEENMDHNNTAGRTPCTMTVSGNAGFVSFCIRLTILS